MVIAPATAQIFDLSKVTYLNGKNSDQINQAAAVEQPSHADMVKVVTGFIDGLINLEVGKLETAASNGSDSKAQQKAQGNLDQYNQDKDSAVTPFVTEVAGDLAKHLFTVKKLLINDDLAEQKDGQELKFKANSAGAGGNIATESAGELAKQALTSVQNRLIGYGISIDIKQAAELQKEIIRELKKPPGLNSEAATAVSAAAASTVATTENIHPENPNISIIDFLKEKQSALAKGLLGSTLVVAFLNQPADRKTGQASGISQLREFNERIGETVGDWNSNLEKVENALKDFGTNLGENTKFITTYLGKDSFNAEFNKLSEDRKIQVGILLKNLETTVDEKTMVNLTGKITGQLGENAKQNLQIGLSSLISDHDNSNTPNTLFTLNLSKANEHLEKYNQALKDIKSKNLSTQQEIQDKQKATNEFLEDIKGDLKNKTLSIEDVKVIQKSLEVTEEKRKSGKASPAIDNIFGNFINSMKEKAKEQGIEITEEGLKQFAGIGVALAIGTTLFCPKLLGGLVQSAFSLGTMLTQTIIPIYNNMTQTNIAKALTEKTKQSN
jgi:hypothetical protein